MKKVLFVFSVVALIAVLMVPASPALADEYEGWDEIGPALLDGNGDEFVVDPNYNFTFPGATELEQVLAAADWVAFHMAYEYDPYPPGDVWTNSVQQFAEIIPGVQGSGTGDCEDISILLCALMRFNIGVPADRVWVQAGLVVNHLSPERPPLVGHAYIVYKMERGGIVYIEPQIGGIPYRGSYPSILHLYFKKPPQSGESAMLRFNDQWVKGGGFFLAGRR